MAVQKQFLTTRYGGYYAQQVPEDPELTHVEKGSACGELLRRYWQPVALSSEVKDLPGTRLAAWAEKQLDIRVEPV